MAGPNFVSGNLKILIVSIVLIILERLLDFVILHPSLVYPMMESYIEQFVLKPNGLEKVKFPSFWGSLLWRSRGFGFLRIGNKTGYVMLWHWLWMDAACFFRENKRLKDLRASDSSCAKEGWIVQWSRQVTQKQKICNCWGTFRFLAFFFPKHFVCPNQHFSTLSFFERGWTWRRRFLQIERKLLKNILGKNDH